MRQVYLITDQMRGANLAASARLDDRFLLGEKGGEEKLQDLVRLSC